MQALYNKTEINESFAGTTIRRILRGKIKDDEVNRISGLLLDGAYKRKKYSDDCKKVTEVNKDRIEKHLKPAMIKAGVVCAGLMIFAIWWLVKWEFSNLPLYIVECIGFCAAVLMIVFFLQNRQYPKLKQPFCDHYLFNEAEITKINSLLEANPEIIAELTAYKKANSYFAMIQGNETDVTKFVTSTAKDIVTLEFSVNHHLEYVLPGLDGTPDNVMVETYYCLKEKGEQFIAAKSGNNDDRNELIRIYRMLKGRITAR